MSHILQQEDNITILGDIYEYPIYKWDTEEVKEKRTAIHLQIIIVVNGKQKIFRTNYDVNVKDKWLVDYESWYNLSQFLESIWYNVGFDMHNQIEQMIEHKEIEL